MVCQCKASRTRCELIASVPHVYVIFSLFQYFITPCMHVLLFSHCRQYVEQCSLPMHMGFPKYYKSLRLPFGPLGLLWQARMEAMLFPLKQADVSQRQNKLFLPYTSLHSLWKLTRNPSFLVLTKFSQLRKKSPRSILNQFCSDMYLRHTFV